MRDVILLGDGRDPTAYTNLPKDEWPESIVVYHSGHSHDEVPIVYTKLIDASQASGKSSSIARDNINRVLSSTIHDSCEDVDDAETLLDDAKQIIRALYNENIELRKACGDGCPTSSDANDAHTDKLKQRIRELEAENDALAREVSDLRLGLRVLGLVSNERG